MSQNSRQVHGIGRYDNQSRVGNDETQNGMQERNKELNEKFLLKHSARAPGRFHSACATSRANQQLSGLVYGEMTSSKREETSPAIILT